VRPLLAFRREDLRAYLRGLGQPWREDATNRDLKRLRARVRERLMPLLEAEFSPHIVDHLAVLARLAREEEVFWNALADDRLSRLASMSREGASISVSDLLAPLAPFAGPGNGKPEPLLASTPPCRALTERLIRKMYAAVRGDRCDLSARQVEQVIHLASRSTSGRRVELPGGISVQRDFGQISFLAPRRGRPVRAASAASRAAPGYVYALTLPERGSIAVSVRELHTRFRLKVIDWPVSPRETRMEYGALDAERLHSPLILRNWRPGDCYRPRERRRSRKLKEMLREARIARGERAVWPVLESGGRIVWARDLPPAGDFCAGEGTRVGVLVEVDPPVGLLGQDGPSAG
jgi:tRNA(Ile)-lysidine synthase